MGTYLYAALEANAEALKEVKEMKGGYTLEKFIEEAGLAAKWRNRGVERGMEKGIAQGMEKGIMQVARAMLRKRLLAELIQKRGLDRGADTATAAGRHAIALRAIASTTADRHTIALQRHCISDNRPPRNRATVPLHQQQQSATQSRSHTFAQLQQTAIQSRYAPLHQQQQTATQSRSHTFAQLQQTAIQSRYAPLRQQQQTATQSRSRAIVSTTTSRHTIAEPRHCVSCNRPPRNHGAAPLRQPQQTAIQSRYAPLH
jgi:hypothetical protein